MAGNKIPDVFSTHSAAKFCRVTPMTIIRWVEEGRIRAYKTPGGHRRIMRADLEQFCRDNSIPMQWEERVSGGTQRVLIIDDDVGAVNAILDALLDDAEADSESAYVVEHASNPFDGGRMLGSFRPDIVFLDLDLPGIDPQTVAQSIRKNPATNQVRIIGITSSAGQRPSGVDNVLSRPIAKTAVRQATGPLPVITPRR